MATSSLDALPVSLVVAGTAAGRVRRLVEGELGWQALDAGPVEVVLADVAGAPAAGTGGPPSVLLVSAEDDPHATAEAVRRLAPTEIVRWPPRTGDELRDAVAAALRRTPPRERGTGEALVVGGASGGVGTTTVALALGGLVAWGGRGCTVVTHGAVPHPTRAAVDADALGSPTLSAALEPARGVPGLALLRVHDGRSVDPAAIGGVVVVDRGVETTVDVLVCRRDVPGTEAVAATSAGTIVVTDSGPVPWSAVKRAAGGRRVVLVPWSARVARAAALGRVPASLPGSWLARLGPLLGGRTGRG